MPDWTGQWNGPEGTALKLEAMAGGKFAVIIRNLDGERRFEGVRQGTQVHFERDGRQEVIKGTDGAGTGMKWLADKTNCLTVNPGEGYCRE